MAVIGSIRKRGTLLLVVIGGSMAAFILGDVFTRYGSSGDDSAAIINGKKISAMEYSALLQNKENLYLTINPQMEMNDQTRQSIADEVFNELVNVNVFYKEFEKLGVNITTDEMEDMLFGTTVHPMILQQFTNPQTGQFDANQVVQYSSQFEDETAVPEEQKQQWLTAKTYWAFLQRTIREDRLMSKYNNLISKGVYVTSKEAASNYKATNDRANVRFVGKLYTQIPDSTITVSDDEVSSYFNEFKWKFRQKKSRSVKYVLFNAIPTATDTVNLRNTITTLKNEFAASTDDTTFVYQNSDYQMEPTFFKKGDLTPTLDTVLFNAPVGTIVGPYIDNGYFIVGKKLAEKMESDSIQVSHILLVPQSQEDLTKFEKLRDSLLTELNKGANFYALQAQFSQDEAAKADSGNIGWVTRQMQTAPQFIDSVYATGVGKYRAAISERGLHIIYVTQKTKELLNSNIAILSKQIVPSEETKQVAFNAATEFSSVNTEDKSFDPDTYFTKTAATKGLIIRDDNFIVESSQGIAGLEGTKDFVRWALTGKRGEISQVFSSGNTYIVGLITAIRIDGIPQLEDIRKDVELAAKKHKISQQFVTEMESAMQSAKNIDALAGQLKTNVQTGADVTFGSYIMPGAGFEPELIGAVFGSKPNVLSKPIVGNSGVFVFVVDGMNPAPPAQDYTFNKMQLMQMISGRAVNEASGAVKEKANIIDNRYKLSN